MGKISVILLCCFLLLFSCKSKSNSRGNKTGEITISFKSEIAPAGKLKVDAEKVTCTIGSTAVKAKRAEEKRNYSVGDNSYSAKQKANKIKLYNRDGALLWKVKIGDSKMKISQSEEGEPLYVVKIKESKHKIMQGETLIAAVKQKEDKSGIKIKNATNETLYKIKTTEFSLSFSLLAMSTIPADQRAILLSELYLAGY